MSPACNVWNRHCRSMPIRAAISCWLLTLASGCNCSHDAVPADAASTDGSMIADAGQDAGPRIIDPDTPPPDGALAMACDPDTIFVPIDGPGCVRRDIAGTELRTCSDPGDATRTIGGQPVTVLNRSGKVLSVSVAVLFAECDTAGCISINADNPNSCDCGAGGAAYDPWRFDFPRADPSPLFIAIVDHFVAARSFVLGGRGVMFRVTACTT